MKLHRIRRNANTVKAVCFQKILFSACLANSSFHYAVQATRNYSWSAHTQVFYPDEDHITIFYKNPLTSTSSAQNLLQVAEGKYFATSLEIL